MSKTTLPEREELEQLILREADPVRFLCNVVAGRVSTGEVTREQVQVGMYLAKELLTGANDRDKLRRSSSEASETLVDTLNCIDPNYAKEPIRRTFVPAPRPGVVVDLNYEEI